MVSHQSRLARLWFSALVAVCLWSCKSETAPAGICEQEEECLPGERCIGGRCIFEDPTSLGIASCGLCQPGFVCDQRSGACILGGSGTDCTTDVDCLEIDGVCRAGSCQTSCTLDTRVCGTEETCNLGTGQCVAVGAECREDSDCPPGKPSAICQTGRCTLGCIDPSISCPADFSCDEASGYCISNNKLPLGTACKFDVECESQLCFATERGSYCSRACGKSADCPVGSTCFNQSGFSACISETRFPEGTLFRTAEGDDCSEEITCQSRWCNPTANTCLETCSGDRDCSDSPCAANASSSGGTTTYTQLCAILFSPAGEAGEFCTSNSECESGICHLELGGCAKPCCTSEECEDEQACLPYQMQDATLTKICQPLRAGTSTLGAACVDDGDCESGVCFGSPSAPATCTQHCCTNADCQTISSQAVCRPSTVGTFQVGVCQS